MNRYIYLSLLLLLLSCNKEKFFDGPDAFSDDFEAYADIDSLLSGADDEFWSFFQSTQPENVLSIDTTVFHSGGKSIRTSAVPSNDAEGASKCSFAKQNMAFWEGETVSVSAWYYLEGTASAQWLFLMDLEEQTAIGAGPGIRVAVVDEALTIEHKYPRPNIHQPEDSRISFPRDQWVHVRLEVLLSQKKKGYIKLFQDGSQLIEQNDWQTLPKDILYFQQGTKGMYSSVEFGLTANTFENDMVLYVDDVEIKTVN